MQQMARKPFMRAKMGYLGVSVKGRKSAVFATHISLRSTQG
jgi:hypothetical protein